MSERVGHAGTLDPFASGLLLVLMGQATRLSRLFLELPKEYELTVQYCHRGKVRQRVPLTSAVKVQGERLYKKAHRGESAETPEREVMIYELTLLDVDERAQTARVVALTGSGAYLRVLAEDLGAATGAGGYASALRRTRVGGFCVGNALAVDDLSAERYADLGPGVLDLSGALARLPIQPLAAAQARLAQNGSTLDTAVEGRFRVFGGDRLIGVYEGRDGRARPVVIFPQEA
jgi:tRNA pseudouridine55 synthase